MDTYMDTSMPIHPAPSPLVITRSFRIVTDAGNSDLSGLSFATATSKKSY